MSYSLTGTSRSNPSGGAFDMMSFQCVGVGALIEGKWSSNGFCEYLDADGDKSLGKATRIGPKGTWKFVAGTGKFAGITGGGTNETLGQFPTIKPGTFQGCNRAVGTYKLP
jgi:hypothetical protein